MIATVTNIGSASSPVHYFEQDGYLRKTAGMLPPSLQSGMQGICGPGLSGCLDQALALLHAVPKPHGERGINGETAERRLAVRRFSPTSRTGRAPSAPGCRAIPPSSRPWTT